MSWLKKVMPARIRTEPGAPKKRSVPEGLWEKCDRCGSVLYRPEPEENLEVCPTCNHHRAIRARVRLRALVVAGSTQENGAALGAADVLQFQHPHKYVQRINRREQPRGGVRGTSKSKYR